MQPLTVNAAKGHFYYRCQSTQNGSADTCTMRKNIRADTIEDEVWEFVSRYVDDSEAMMEIVSQMARRDLDKAENADRDAKALSTRLQELEKQAANYQRAFAADALSLDDLKSRMAETDAERKFVKRELDKLARSTRDTHAIRAMYARAMEDIKANDEYNREIMETIEYDYGELPSYPVPSEERHERYRQLQVRITVGADKVPHITGAFDMDFLLSRSESWQEPYAP